MLLLVCRHPHPIGRHTVAFNQHGRGLGSPHQSHSNPLWDTFKNGTEARRKRARDELLINFSPLVRYVAHRVGQTLPASVDHADLESYGMFGLIDAIDKFEPGRGFKFETYAISRIKGNILDELRAIDWVPRSVRAKAREIDRATQELEAKLNRSPSDTELAAEMDVDVTFIHNARSRTASSYIASLDERTGTDSDDGAAVTIGSTVADRRENPEQDILGIGDITEMLAEAMTLPLEREKVVLTLYYLEGLTLAQIGGVIGVTESRVCQIHTKASVRLREHIQPAEREAEVLHSLLGRQTITQGDNLVAQSPLRWFPVADLLQFIEIRARAEDMTDGEWIAKHFGCRGTFRRQYDRMRADPDRTIKLHTADEYAGHLGVHPSAIWPEWFGHLEPAGAQ